VKLRDKVAVVTGGASGIGAALCRRFVEEGARAVVVVDCNEDGAKAVAEEIGGVAIAADVTVEADVINVVNATENRFGQIDLFCSNAGVTSMDGPTAASAPNEVWETSWGVNLMAHVYAARAVLPKMIGRGDGYLLNTSSAAGVLSQIGSAPYSVTKHASVAFAECLAIAHGNDGIKVSVLCPQAVRTPMLGGFEDGNVAGVDGVLEPSEVADCVIKALDEERFLILPHPKVLTYMQRKASDYDRWLGGMRRLRARFFGSL
jgi:NAD(P)-dependent dehydrogenase (short-subunit alcohol dehydrogenase family)